MLFYMRRETKEPTESCTYTSLCRMHSSGNKWEDQGSGSWVDKTRHIPFKSDMPFNQSVNQAKEEINHEPREILSNQVSKTEKGTFPNTARFATCMVGPGGYALPSASSSLVGLVQGS